MVIRANELNLPAVVGIGEKKFREIKRHKIVILDCKNKTLSKI